MKGITGGELLDLTADPVDDPDIPFVEEDLVEETVQDAAKIDGIVVVRTKIDSGQSFFQVLQKLLSFDVAGQVFAGCRFGTLDGGEEFVGEQ